MSTQRYYSFWERVRMWFGLFRDWQIIESKSTPYRDGWYNTGTKTYALERCSRTGRERGRVYYSPGIAVSNHSMDVNALKIHLKNIK